jgi:hypothetical protein
MKQKHLFSRWDAAYYLGAAVPMNLGMPLAVVLIYIGEAGRSIGPRTLQCCNIAVFSIPIFFRIFFSACWTFYNVATPVLLSPNKVSTSI